MRLPLPPHHQRPMLCGAGIDGQTVGLFHKQVAEIAKLRFLGGRFLVQLSIRIGGRFMGFIRALLSYEIQGRVSLVIGGIALFASLLLETFVSRPGLDECAVNLELLVRKDLLVFENDAGDVTSKQSFTILAFLNLPGSHFSDTRVGLSR